MNCGLAVGLFDLHIGVFNLQNHLSVYPKQIVRQFWIYEEGMIFDTDYRGSCWVFQETCTVHPDLDYVDVLELGQLISRSYEFQKISVTPELTGVYEKPIQGKFIPWLPPVMWWVFAGLSSIHSETVQIDPNQIQI